MLNAEPITCFLLSESISPEHNMLRATMKVGNDRIKYTAIV